MVGTAKTLRTWVRRAEQALWARRPGEKALIHHSDRGSQYLSIRYTDRLIEAGIEPSVGSVGDSYDNALAETVIGLFKTEVTHRRSWRSREEVEWETLGWVDRCNNRRLPGSIGNIPQEEAEAAYYAGVTVRTTYRPMPAQGVLPTCSTCPIHNSGHHDATSA